MPQHLEGGISLTYDWTGRKPYSYGREWGLSGQLELKSGDTKYHHQNFGREATLPRFAAPRAFL